MIWYPVPSYGRSCLKEKALSIITCCTADPLTSIVQWECSAVLISVGTETAEMIQRNRRKCPYEEIPIIKSRQERNQTSLLHNVIERSAFELILPFTFFFRLTFNLFLFVQFLWDFIELSWHGFNHINIFLFIALFKLQSKSNNFHCLYCEAEKNWNGNVLLLHFTWGTFPLCFTISCIFMRKIQLCYAPISV